MQKTFILFIILLSGLLWSCGKELTEQLSPESTAIVESYIYAGDSNITIKITKLLPFSDDTDEATEYISGLHLQINGSDLTETATGIYTLTLGEERIKPGETYILKFGYYADTVSSSTIIPEKPEDFAISESYVYADRITSSGGFPGGSGPMEDIDLTWTNDDGSYYYVLIEYLESTPDYINFNMADADISTVQSIAPMSSSGTRLGMRNLYFFGTYRIVLFKVNKDFVDLYQQTSANSNNITNPVTTINNGFGVFTGMASDTLYLDVLEN